MVIIKSKNEIEQMKKSAKISSGAIKLAGSIIQPGITTGDIDKQILEFILTSGGVPSFLHYQGFPNSVCISINDEVIHGIPGGRKLKDGDIVSIDVGVKLFGMHTDTAKTFACGTISSEAKKLIQVTEQSFFEGIKYAREGYRIGDLGSAVDEYVKSYGYSTVKIYNGHGVGFELHEDPAIPNYGTPGKGTRFIKGMSVAVEPMINQGTDEIKVLKDGWTVITKDGRLSSHYEHTVIITDGQALPITYCD